MAEPSLVVLVACRSCRVGVRWVETVTGSRMPLDPDPTPDGNVEFTHPDREEGPVRVLKASELAGDCTRYRYKSHFATCPHARTWSKGKTPQARDRTLKKLDGGR